MRQPIKLSSSFDLPDRKAKYMRWAALTAGGLVALIVALTLLQCGIKKPESPSWTSTLRLPLAADHFDIANLLGRLDGGDQLIDENGNIGLFLVDTLDTVTLGADLLIPSQSIVVAQDVGQIKVAAIAGGTVRSDRLDFFGSSPSVFPAFDIIDIDSLGPLPAYTWIAPYSGNAYVVIENQFGLDFDSVSITLTDLTNGPLGVFNFPGGISAGATDSQSISLGGTMLSNHFQYQLYAHTPGGTPLAVSNPYIEVSFAFSDTVVIDSGLLEVPSVTKVQSQIVAFNGNADILAIRSAEMSAGSLSIGIENKTALTTGVTFSVPSLTLGGVALSRNVAMLPWSTTNLNVDLSGYTWVPEEPNAPQYFAINAVASTVPSAPAHVLISLYDSVIVSAQLTGLQAQQITGVLAPQQVTLPTFQETITVPSELTALHPADASLSLEIVNGTGADAALDFLLTADNGNTLTLSGTAIAGSAGAPVTSTIYEPNLAAFLDPFPGSVSITGTATFGDSVSEVTVGASDFAFARVTLSAPLAVRIDSFTIEGLPEAQSISGSDVSAFTDDLESGTIHLEVANHLPIATDITLYVATDSASVYTTPDLQLGPISIAAGATDISGIVFDTTRSVTNLTLTAADLQLFDSPTLYFGYRIFMPGSGGQVVRITAADYLDLVAYFTLTMRNGKGAW